VQTVETKLDRKRKHDIESQVCDQMGLNRLTKTLCFVALPLMTLYAQPMMVSQCFWSIVAIMGWVSISAGWSSEWVAWMVMSPCSTWCQKWWYWTFRCLVLGRILYVVAISNAPLLSSNTQQWTFGVITCMSMPCAAISFANSISGMTCRKAAYNETYSDLVDESAIRPWSLDAQSNGQPAKKMTYPHLDLVVSGSSPGSPSLSQFPAKSALT